MIPRSQHFGDRAPLPFHRAGIVRIFEEAGFEAFLGSAGRCAHYAGKQPNASIEQHQRGTFTAREHDIADRDFLDLTALENPLVKAFEAAVRLPDGAAS